MKKTLGFYNQKRKPVNGKSAKGEEGWSIEDVNLEGGSKHPPCFEVNSTGNNRGEWQNGHRSPFPERKVWR